MQRSATLQDVAQAAGVSTATVSRALSNPDLLSERTRAAVMDAIRSTGYVLHTLEASVWCLLTTGSYSDAVLRAVNLGSDTDTTGAVTGALAGLNYGLDNIPAEWRQQLARHDDIEDLAERRWIR